MCDLHDGVTGTTLCCADGSILFLGAVLDIKQVQAKSVLITNSETVSVMK